MATSEDWRSVIQKRIQERDELDAPNIALFASYKQVYERLTKAENVVSRLEATDTEQELQNTIKQVDDLTTTVLEKNQKIQQLEETSTKLRNQLKAVTKDKASLNTVVTRLTNKLNDRSEEHQYRNKSMEILNDELIAMQIENNLLHNKLEKMEKENEDLVQRWLQKVQQDAEKFNDFIAKGKP
ncbi:CYFA0S01e15940g1_1 [Cyberlindnera fabianii]|uniref:CYFA0S01e15940g1_1 n=1 Tax=Cyberlindnera fabianii TaxID=36022 RepID=A0A061ASM2_CYBFA|nr:CYFA0S01e15940g1_1 [Cyberlindnera fabianii]